MKLRQNPPYDGRPTYSYCYHLTEGRAPLHYVRLDSQKSIVPLASAQAGYGHYGGIEPGISDLYRRA